MAVFEIEQKNCKGFGMKCIKTHIHQVKQTKMGKLTRFTGALLSPIYWAAAHLYSVPGLKMHRYAFFKGMDLLIRQKFGLEYIYNLLFFPMDSVRYFEYDFLWHALYKKPLEGNFLDISSPRLILAILMSKFRKLNVEIVNPDQKDLSATRELMNACGYSDRCRFRDSLIADLDFRAESFDIITSISVIEHIPGEEDKAAVEKLWQILRPGGSLILSVPCAREAFEEYIDFDEYGLLTPGEDGFVFGQRFYDEILLEKRIFSITGKPITQAIYGENKSGALKENRQEKISTPDYPFWREPLMMGKEYSYFQSISDLPGWGVIAMEFIKQ